MNEPITQIHEDNLPKLVGELVEKQQIIIDLLNQLPAIVKIKINEEKKKMNEENLKRNAFLNKSLDDFDLSVRTRNCLIYANKFHDKQGLRRYIIKTISDLTGYTAFEIRKIPGLGLKSFIELRDLLAKEGLTFRDDV